MSMNGFKFLKEKNIKMSWRHLTKKQRDWIYALLMIRSPLDEPEEEVGMLGKIQENLDK